jgi:hypothetical protein
VPAWPPAIPGFPATGQVPLSSLPQSAKLLRGFMQVNANGTIAFDSGIFLSIDHPSLGIYDLTVDQAKTGPLNASSAIVLASLTGLADPTGGAIDAAPIAAGVFRVKTYFFTSGSLGLFDAYFCAAVLNTGF